MSPWEEYDYDYLVSILSDYHKDIHGYRLRMYGEPREAIIAALDALDAYMNAMKSTPEGRAQLREEGWYIQQST